MSSILPPAGQEGDSLSDQDPERELAPSAGLRPFRRIGFLLFTLAMTVLLVKLGMWQVSRAAEKEALLTQLDVRQQHTLLRLSDLPKEGKGYRIDVLGQFDASKSVLLDNQTHLGRVGYRWMMPFKATQDNNEKWLLVELGWVPAPATRDVLPTLPNVKGAFHVRGIIDLPSDRVVLGGASESVSWPWRVQSVDMAAINAETGESFYPWVVRAASVASDTGEQLETTWNVIPVWEPVVMKPEKHYAYAMQWFGLALVVWVGFLIWWRKGRV
ncbi:SURF1 family protein [Enterovibrio norvegicus]|uniref:SURF1 family protein n=1 Tax=Enterovibrio norvegicus TaxID=188144 RepID=UPI000369A1FA|nr:SURF1 family protein [Enterovibrio norvegicus]